MNSTKSAEKKLKKEYERKIASGSYELIYKRPKNNDNSKIWSVFSLFADENGTTNKKWVYCRRCKEVMKYFKYKLLEHDCYETWIETHKDKEEIPPSSDAAAEELSKQQVMRKISDGTYKLMMDRIRTGLIYKIFAAVIANSEEWIGYVYCVLCKRIYKYNRVCLLKRHRCYLKCDLVEEDDPTENEDNSGKFSSESLKEWPLDFDASQEEVLSYIKNLIADEKEGRDTVADTVADTCASKHDKNDNSSENKKEERQMYLAQERAEKFRINGLIENGTYKLTMTKGRSMVWKKFAIITDKDGCMVEDRYVCCIECKQLYKFGATSVLLRHKCLDNDDTKDSSEDEDSEDIDYDDEDEDEDEDDDEMPLAEFANTARKKRKIDETEEEGEEMDIIRRNIQYKMSTGVYELTTNPESSHSLWTKFSFISSSEGTILKGFVCCQQCKMVLHYNDKDETQMKKHICGLKEHSLGGGVETDVSNFEMDLIKKSIENKLALGVYKLKENRESVDPIWSIYKLIAMRDGSLLQEFVYCTECKRLLEYKSEEAKLDLKKHECYLQTALATKKEDISNNSNIDDPEDFEFSTDSSNDNDVLPSRNVSESMDYSDNDEETEFIDDVSKSSELKATTPSTQISLKAIEKNPQPSMKPEIISNRPFKIQEVKSMVNTYPIVNIVNESNSTLLKAAPKDVISVNPGQTSAKLVLEEKLKKGIYKLFMKPNETNLLWKIYAFIRKDDDSTEEFWVHCSHCKQLVEYKNKDSTLLSHHKCYTIALQTMKEEDRQEALKVYSQWIIEDCQPIAKLDGLGFQKLAKHFMSLGAKYGDKLQIEKLIPSAQTLTERIREKFEARKLEIIAKIKENSTKSTITIDFWSDLMIKRNYFNVSLHYVNDFQLCQTNLGLKSIDYNEEPPKEAIRTELADLLNDFGLDNFKNLIFVTEKNDHLEKALEDCYRLNCSCTLLAQVIDAAIAKTPELLELIKTCKKIKKYFKKSQNYCLMDNSSALTLCQTPYELFKAINDNWTKVKENLPKLKEMGEITDNSEKSLQSLVELCKKFEFIFKRLQETRQTSLCFVIPSIQRLKVICKPLANDPLEIAALKANLLEKLEEIWLPNVQIWHKAAFFLYPPAKQEQANDLTEIREFCVTQMKSLQPEEEILPSATTDENNDDDIVQDPDDLDFFFPTLAKHSKASPTTNITTNAEEEIKRYCAETVVIDKTFEVFNWWLKNSAKYPLLSRLAIQILSIPSSARAMELKYALNQNIMNERRNVFSPKHVDSILFLNSLAQSQEL